MNQEETKKALIELRKYVIQQSKSNLSRLAKNSSKKLYNSIEGEVEAYPNSISLFFTMEDYGFFQDQGVKGKTSGSKAPASPFRFGTGTGKKGGLTNGIQKWVRKRSIQFRDKKSGRFLSYQSTAFLITRSIWHKGMKPSLFFTKPFENAIKRMPEEITKAYGLDASKLIDSIMNSNFKK